jgi:hypothetical protein
MKWLKSEQTKTLLQVVRSLFFMARAGQLITGVPEPTSQAIPVRVRKETVEARHQKDDQNKAFAKGKY